MEGGQAMEDDNIISLIYDKKNTDEMFNLKDEELDSWKEKIEQTRKELFDLVNSKLYPKYLNRFTKLMLDLEDAKSEAFFIQTQLYYKEGFKDGAKLSKELNAE